MPNEITLTSTSDTRDAVEAALGIVKATAPAVPEPAAAEEPPVAPDPELDAAVGEDEDDEPAPSPQQQQAGKKRGRLQGRIDKLVGERDSLRAMTATQQAELDALRRRVGELAATMAAPAQTTPPAGRPAAAAAAPTPEPKIEDFKDYESFTKALVLWAAQQHKPDVESVVQQRLKEEQDRRDAEQAKLTHTQREQVYQQAVIATRAKYDDYDEVVNDPALRATPLMTDQLLRLGDRGPEVAYYLAKHPDLCNRLFALGNTAEALKEFGKIEARVEDALQQAAAPPTAAGREQGNPLAAVAAPAGKPRVTRAPDPVAPIGGQVVQTTKNPDEMTYQEYREYRNSQIRKRAGLK